LKFKLDENLDVRLAAAMQANGCALPDLDQDLPVGTYSERVGICKCIGGRARREEVSKAGLEFKVQMDAGVAQKMT
jgi:hypothetical protein